MLSGLVEFTWKLRIEDKVEASGRGFVEWAWEADACEADCREILLVLEVGRFDQGGEARAGQKAEDSCEGLVVCEFGVWRIDRDGSLARWEGERFG